MISTAFLMHDNAGNTGDDVLSQWEELEKEFEFDPTELESASCGSSCGASCSSSTGVHDGTTLLGLPVVRL